FSLLTVHSRPPFPFTFCFLPPVNSGGTAGAVFCPVGFRDEHAAADRTAFQVLITENLRFQRPVQRQDRPAEPLTADRERSRLRAGAGVPIVKDNAVAVLTATALPAYQGVCLF
ncbi:Major facilitator superfamily (MFS) profile domain-containing protein, partial [Dysosmobacter welbionis]